VFKKSKEEEKEGKNYQPVNRLEFQIVKCDNGWLAMAEIGREYFSSYGKGMRYSNRLKMFSETRGEAYKHIADFFEANMMDKVELPEGCLL